jgi:hypothetical protein
MEMKPTIFLCSWSCIAVYLYMQDIFTLTKIDQVSRPVHIACCCNFWPGSCWWNTGHYTLHFGTLHKRTYCNKHYTSLHYLALHYSRLHHVLILSKHFQSFYHYFTSAFPLIIDLLPWTRFFFPFERNSLQDFPSFAGRFSGWLAGMMVNVLGESSHGLRFQLFNTLFRLVKYYAG